MRLRGEDELHPALGHTRRKRRMSGRDVLRNIGQHVFAALNVFVEKIGSELRIQNPGGTDGEGHKQQDGNNGDKESRNDEAIAQTPEQAIPSPSEQAIEKIKGGEQRNEF